MLFGGGSVYSSKYETYIGVERMEDTTQFFVHVVIKSLYVCSAGKDEEIAASVAVIPFIFVLSSFLSSPSCWSTQDNSIFGIYLAFQTLSSA